MLGFLKYILFVHRDNKYNLSIYILFVKDNIDEKNCSHNDQLFNCYQRNGMSTSIN